MADILQITINGNAAGLIAATTQSEQALGRLEGTTTKTGNAVTAAFGVAAVAGIAALGAGLTAAVSSAMGFEKQMSAVGAVAGATASEMQSLTSLALQLGKDTSFSAKEAAVGLEELTKAGVSIADIMGGAGRAALDLAAAGAIGVGDAAEIAANAMNVFGIEGAHMAHVADVIAGAANASAIGVNDYKFSLAAAGAVANTVGISFESLSTAIAVMGQAGIKGSDAGTSLKTMMMNLIPMTKQQNTVFRELGIVTKDGANQFFDATGKAKSFSEIAQVLQDALRGMTKEQQLATLEIMFGSDAIRAGAVLLDAGAAGFENMATAMGKVTAQQVAEERLNNLAGSLEKLKGSLETGAIILGGVFTPALKRMADMATEEVNKAINILEQLPDAWGTLKQAFEGGWEPSEILTPFINAVGLAGLKLRELFGPTVQAALAGDLAGTLAGLGTAFGQLSVMMGTWIGEQVAKIPWADIWAGVKLTAQMVFDGIATAVGALDAQLTPWLNAQIAAIDWSGIGRAFGESLVGSMQTGIDGAVGGGGTAFDFAALDAALTAFLVGVVTGAWEKTLENWRAQEPGAGYQKVFVDGLDEAGWRGAIHNLGNALTEEWNANRQKDYDNFQQWNTEKTAALIAWGEETKAVIQTWNTDTTALVTTWAAEQVAAFNQWNTDTTTTVTTWATDTKTAIDTWNTDTTAVITTWVTETLAAFTQWWADALAGFTTWIGEVGTTLSDGWNGMHARVGEAWDAIWTLIGQKASDIAGLFTTMVADWIQAGTDMATGLVKAVGDGLANLAETVIAPIKRAIDSVRGMLNFGGAGATQLSNTSGIRHGDLVNMAAQSENVPADVIAAIMGTEGSGDRSTSGAGARGPMQVMPFHFRSGEDPMDPATNIRVGARVLRQNYERYGNWESAAAAYYGAVDSSGRPTSATDGSGVTGHEYVRRFSENRQRYQATGAAIGSGRGAPQVSQFQMGLSPGEAEAACGPAALAWFMNQTGRTPSGQEARDLAAAAGWDASRGMYGPQALVAAGIRGGISLQADMTPTAGEVGSLAASGTPFAISTGGTATGPGHYYQVSGGTLGALNVGGSGTALRCGAGVMSLDQILALSGPMNAIITLSGQMGEALTVAGEQGGQAFNGLAVAGTSAGQTLVTTSTDALGNVTTLYSDATGVIGATVTDAAGSIVNSFGTIPTGMVTAGAALVTSSTDAMGNVTRIFSEGGVVVGATITTAAGEIVNSWGTVTATVPLQTQAMTDAVTASTNLMTSGALVSVTALGTGTQTIVSEMSGTTIATVTDMGGQVTSQIAQLANGVVLQANGMQEGVITSVNQMADGTITSVQDMAGNVVTTVTDLAGNVTSQYTTMASAAEQTASQTVDAFGEVVDAAEGVPPAVQRVGDSFKNIKPPNLSGVVNEFKKVESAIKSAISAADRFADKTGSKGSPGKGAAGKAAGGPINAFDTYLVGERGPELFMSDRAGTIIPNHALRSGGGGRTDTLVIEFKVDGRTAERIYVEGKDMAARRGRD